MSEDGSEAVVFVKAGERAGCELTVVSVIAPVQCFGEILHTSSASSSFFVNSATTKLICSRCGTYALPCFTNTLRCSTKTGTLSQSTLNHSCSSWFFVLPPAAASNRSFSSLFSASCTSSHSRLRLLTKPCLSIKSSSLKRS